MPVPAGTGLRAAGRTAPAPVEAPHVQATIIHTRNELTMQISRLILLAALLAAAVPATAQHAPESTHHGLQGTHRITLGLGHTHVSEGQIEGKTRWLAVPSWALNYDYWFSDQWAAGLQNDLIIESFVVEHGDSEQIERHYPVAVIPAVLYKPWEHWTFIGGVGMEFASGHNLVLTRLGVEYGVHVGTDWEVGGALVWDNKWDYYNSWGIAFTVSRLLGGH